MRERKECDRKKFVSEKCGKHAHKARNRIIFRILDTNIYYTGFIKLMIYKLKYAKDSSGDLHLRNKQTNSPQKLLICETAKKRDRVRVRFRCIWPFG